MKYEYHIRPIEKRDIEVVRLIHNDESVRMQLTDPTVVSVPQQEKWYESLCESETSSRWVLVRINPHFPDAGVIMGVFRIDNHDIINGSVMVGLDVAPEWRGNGLSYWAYEFFFSYFFEHLCVNRIYLKVLETNEVARHVYEKLGFIEEGRERKAVFRNGKYVDYILMSILWDEYEADRSRHSALAELGKVSRVPALDDKSDG